MKIDSTINKNRIACHMSNGKDIFRLQFSRDSSELYIKGRIYYNQGLLSCWYSLGKSNIHTRNFWVKPGTNEIEITALDSVGQPTTAATTLRNAVDLDNTYDDEFEKGFRQAREQEAILMAQAFEKFGPVMHEDSNARGKIMEQFKKLNHVTIQYLKAFHRDFKSFYVFTHQVLLPTASFSPHDSIYLDFLLAEFKSLYGNDVQSYEGQKAIEIVNRGIRPRSVIGNIQPFRLATVSHGDIIIKKTRNQFILLDFWASWCAPCIKQFPELSRIDSLYRDKGLKLIGIGMDIEREALMKGISTFNLTWPIFWDDTGRLGEKFRLQTIPLLVLLDPDLNIVYDSRDGKSLNEVEKIIEAAIGHKASSSNGKLTEK